MREVFKRLEQGEVIEIEVQTDIIESKSTYPWLFSTFVKQDNDNSHRYEEFLDIKESLILAFAYDEKALYAGSRFIEGWNELYFYANDSKELNSMVNAIFKGSDLVYESNVVKDAKWDFYFSELYPSELEYHHIVSAKIISQLMDEGDDLESSREVEHYVSFQTPTQKDRFVKKLNIDGFIYKDDVATDDFEHGVALVKNQSVTEDEMKKTINELFLQIKKEHGFYEGWSTVLVQKR